MEGRENRDGRANTIRCPNCGSWIPVDVKHQRNPLHDQIHVCYARPMDYSSQIVLRGNAAFELEAGNRGWSVFKPVTQDIGVDYVIAKELCAVMVQLKTATKLANWQYHTTINPFQEGPLSFIVYHYQNDKAMFLIPSTEFWEIPRFKRLKDRVFISGEYSDTMSIDKIREVMGDYEMDKGWDRMERLTKIDGLLQACHSFKAKHPEPS